MRVIENAQVVSKWYSDEERRNVMEFYLDYYRDNCKEYIEDAMCDLYSTEEAKKQNKKYADCLYLSSYFIDELYQTFANGIEIETPFYSEQQAIEFQKLLKDCKLNLTLTEVDRLVGVVSDVLVVPQIFEGAVYLDIITPEKAFVKQNEMLPIIAEEVFYEVGISQDTPMRPNKINILNMWDNEGKLYKIEMPLNSNMKFNFNEQIKKEEIIGVPNYKRMPVIKFCDYLPLSNFWFDGGNKIIIKSFNIDKKMSEWSTVLGHQLSTLVTKGMPTNVRLTIGVNEVISIPASDVTGEVSGDASYITPDNKITEIIDGIIKEIKQFAYSLGFTDALLSGASVTSGFQLFLSKSKLLEISKNRRVYYESSIKDLLQILTIAGQAVGYKLNPITDKQKQEIIITYGENTIAMTEEEKSRSLALKLANKETSLIEEIMKKNKISVENAKVILANRIEYLKLQNPISNTLNETQTKLSNPLDRL